MPDYWCLTCGGRTSMMGHGDRHNEKTSDIILRLQAAYPNMARHKLIRAVGLWQVGEATLPRIPE